MILNLKQFPVKVLFPKNSNYHIDSSVTLPPFADNVIEVFSQLSDFLMAKGRSTPSIVAAGYWLRKVHILTIKSQYPSAALQSKGTVFHIAPGNVDTLFFYSMVISLLCGNRTILRISNKLNNDTQILLNLINQFYQQSDSDNAVLKLLTVIQYPRDNHTTEAISAISNARVIWGSDQSIKHITQFPLLSPPVDSSNNICFPDRYSVAIIQIDKESQLQSTVDNLLRDIKPYFQQACSSAKVIYWLNTAQILQDKFFKLLDQELVASERLAPEELISQLLYSQRLPLLINDNKNSCLLKKYELLQVARVESLSFDSIKSHTGLWVLLSLQINELDDIKLFENCQTVAVSGIEKAHWQYWQANTEQPMKRIVPAGQALAFSHIWDGIDLVNALTNVYRKSMDR